MKKISLVLFSLFITFFFSSCYTKQENMISKIPAITEIPTITKKTKENVTGLKSLSENYVIENVKKANQLLADTNKNLQKAEKKDKKNILKTFVNDYKEIVDFYVDITNEKKVLKIKNELLEYYENTIEFYDNLSVMENDLKIFKENCLAQIKTYDEIELSKEDKLIKSRIEAEYNHAEKQEKMIRDFKTNYERLIPEMKKVEDDIDYFILTLQETAKIYESAYRTVELSMNISNAIDNIQEFTSLNDLSDEVMKSWDNLDGILDNLTDLTNFID